MAENTYKDNHSENKERPQNAGMLQKILVRFFQDRRLHLAWGVFLLFATVYLFIAFVSYLFTASVDQSVVEAIDNTGVREAGEEVDNWLGMYGAQLSYFFIYKWFGLGAFILIPICFVYGWYWVFRTKLLDTKRYLTLAIFLIVWSSITLAYVYSTLPKDHPLGLWVGGIGFEITNFLNALLGWGTILFVVFALIVFVIYFFNITKVDSPNIDLSFKEKMSQWIKDRKPPKKAKEPIPEKREDETKTAQEIVEEQKKNALDLGQEEIDQQVEEMGITLINLDTNEVSTPEKLSQQPKESKPKPIKLTLDSITGHDNDPVDIVEDTHDDLGITVKIIEPEETNGIVQQEATNNVVHKEDNNNVVHEEDNNNVVHEEDSNVVHEEDNNVVHEGVNNVVHEEDNNNVVHEEDNNVVHEEDNNVVHEEDTNNVDEEVNDDIEQEEITNHSIHEEDTNNVDEEVNDDIEQEEITNHSIHEEDTNKVVHEEAEDVSNDIMPEEVGQEVNDEDNEDVETLDTLPSLREIELSVDNEEVSAQPKGETQQIELSIDEPEEPTVEEPTEREEIESEEIEAEKNAEEVLSSEPYDPRQDLSDYQFPTLDLLNEPKAAKVQINKEELEANKERIVETLGHYKIRISSIKATVGPTCTLYEIVPDAGIRISKIKNLEDDIALSLAALGIRIIAPMPGKGTIGIEVPNKNRELVAMHTVASNEAFINDKKMHLPVVFGKTITNEYFMADLAKMPHLLMAGATGQGKSVGLNVILTSLLYKKHPAELKFVLVDPKKVELSLFAKIERHFLAKLPNEEEAIITDTSKVINTLNSLCVEMDNRYDLLKDAFCKNIEEYNTKFLARKLNPQKKHRYLPYIVLVIDELADLMMTAGKEVEQPIARLAQLARAIGIHLVVATQRPSVNVITGIIKANFPARLSFRVTSKIDSRTILDTGGAEQLIGKGDMLYSSGSDLTRIQCAFVDTSEVEQICDFIGAQRGYPDAFHLPEFVSDLSEDKPVKDLSKRDALFEEAARLVVRHQQGSTSLIQRRLSVGYSRAGKLIDQLEQAGIVGQFVGSKARDVLMPDEYALEQLLNQI